MIAIVTKDYSKILPKIKENLPELIQIVLGCINDTKVIEDENKLETSTLPNLISQYLKNCNQEKLKECLGECKNKNDGRPPYFILMCNKSCEYENGCLLPWEK